MVQLGDKVTNRELIMIGNVHRFVNLRSIPLIRYATYGGWIVGSVRFEIEECEIRYPECLAKLIPESQTPSQKGMWVPMI